MFCLRSKINTIIFKANNTHITFIAKPTAPEMPNAIKLTGVLSILQTVLIASPSPVVMHVCPACKIYVAHCV